MNKKIVTALGIVIMAFGLFLAVLAPETPFAIIVLLIIFGGILTMLP